MRVTVNDKEIIFPSALSQVTLGQRIDFDATYGKELNDQLQAITEMPEGPDKDLEAMIWQADNACKFFAFFGELDLYVVKDAVNLAEILHVFNACKQLLADSIDTEQKQLFKWGGIGWHLSTPELKPESEMTFAELIDAKQLLQDIHAVGKGEFDKLLAVCSVYLRPVGEAYDRNKQAERMELFKSLPMDIALHVAFFLVSSMQAYRLFLASSSLPGLRAAGMRQSILKSGDG